ncbi:MAG: SufS family cysteine desulfurase [Candidatus Hydrogenedens sp.]|nr:SufS family cysteine desulfurase [Candidatus Hydrogenedens sp.]
MRHAEHGVLDAQFRSLAPDESSVLKAHSEDIGANQCHGRIVLAQHHEARLEILNYLKGIRQPAGIRGGNHHFAGGRFQPLQVALAARVHRQVAQVHDVALALGYAPLTVRKVGDARGIPVAVQRKPDALLAVVEQFPRVHDKRIFGLAEFCLDLGLVFQAFGYARCFDIGQPTVGLVAVQVHRIDHTGAAVGRIEHLEVVPEGLEFRAAEYFTYLGQGVQAGNQPLERHGRRRIIRRDHTIHGLAVRRQHGGQQQQREQKLGTGFHGGFSQGWGRRFCCIGRLQGGCGFVSAAGHGGSREESATILRYPPCKPLRLQGLADPFSVGLTGCGPSENDSERDVNTQTRTEREAPATVPVVPESLRDIRAQFPIFARTVHDQPLVYLDTAATSQKPARVIERLRKFYSDEYGTVRRGSYLLCQQSTAMFECARKKAASFVNAERPEEIVFLRGVTEAINLAAVSLARSILKPGDEVLVSAMEHHANIVPWQLVRDMAGIHIRVIPMNDKGELCLDAYEAMLSERVKVVALNHVANSLGTINPIKQITALAHGVGAIVLVDGAQSAPHLKIDVRDLDCDLYAVSGHKMYGPSGAGFLYGRYSLLERMAPYQGGGEMIDRVEFSESTFEDPPYRFEAGTPPIAEVIGLGEAIDFLHDIGLEAIEAWDQALLAYATARLSAIPGLRFVGEAEARSGLVAFTIDGMHPFDVASILDRKGVAVRAGHHCAQPVMRHFDVPATLRASFGVYTVPEDIDTLAAGLELARDMLS